MTISQRLLTSSPTILGHALSAGVLAATMALLAGGCRKAAPPAPAAATGPETVGRVHWLGKKRMGAEANAAYFMTLWNLPESAQLEAQSLDKLALALAGGTGV